MYVTSLLYISMPLILKINIVITTQRACPILEYYMHDINAQRVVSTMCVCVVSRYVCDINDMRALGTMQNLLLYEAWNKKGWGKYLF